MISADNYDVSYKNNKNAGTATAVITFKGDRYEGTAARTFNIAKASNSITKVTSSKTIYYSRLKKSSQSFTLSATVKGSAKKTFSLVSAKKSSKSYKSYFSVTKAGKMTVKKGLAKGTYTVRVKVSAAATSNYKAASATRTVKVTVK